MQNRSSKIICKKMIMNIFWVKKVRRSKRLLLYESPMVNIHTLVNWYSRSRSLSYQHGVMQRVQRRWWRGFTIHSKISTKTIVLWRETDLALDVDGSHRRSHLSLLVHFHGQIFAGEIDECYNQKSVCGSDSLLAHHVGRVLPHHGFSPRFIVEENRQRNVPQRGVN